MTRRPVAISLGEYEEKAETKKGKKKPAVKKKRGPKALPIPKEATADYFDDAPFMDEAGDIKPQNHLPDISKGFRWGSIFITSLLALVSIGASLWFINLIEALFARNTYLGWAGIGIVCVATLSLLVLIIKELLSIARLRRLATIRNDAEEVLLGTQPADKLIANLKKLYGKRADLKWHLNELSAYEDEIMDDADRLHLYEKTLISSLDKEAKRIIASAARRVSVITALNPSAILDILFVGFQVVKMLRKLMVLYGGKPALFGTLKLARMAATHLAITGGLALSDTLLQQFLGKGLAGRLSTKLGEGTVNGIMTTRIGLSAIELCRPLPFSAVGKPNLKGFLSELINVGKE